MLNQASSLEFSEKSDWAIAIGDFGNEREHITQINLLTEQKIKSSGFIEIKRNIVSIRNSGSQEYDTKGKLISP